MKKNILFALGFSCLLFAAKAASHDSSAWYTPTEYQQPSSMVGTASVRDNRGNNHKVEYEILFDENGNAISSTLESAIKNANISTSVNTAIDVANTALLEAGRAYSETLYISAQIETLGKNLTKVFQIDGMKINSGGKTFTLRIPQGALKNAIVTGSTVEYTDEDGLLVKADEKTLTDITRNGIRVIGWKSAPTSEPSLAELKDNGEIGWVPLKVDNRSVEKNKNDAIAIKGWLNSSPCLAELSEMLTNPNDPNRSQHLFLAKAGGELHYVPLGEVISTNSTSINVDEKSIAKVTETGEDGKESDKISLVGFKDAGGSNASPVIPFSGDGDNLLWRSFLEFFNQGLFKLHDGKITLTGLEGKENESRILTVSSSTTGEALTSESLDTLVDNPLKIEENKITLAGWNDDNATSSTLADALSKPGEEKLNDSVLVRSGTDLSYWPIGSLLMSVVADETSITTNNTLEALALNGFNEAKENEIPFRDASVLGWKKIHDFLDAAVDNKSIALHDNKLEVKGASSVSSPRKYFGSSTTSANIGWYDLPNVTTNRVDADEITLTTHTISDGNVKTVRWKTAPGPLPSLAKMGDREVEWVPLSDVNSVVGVDNLTIQTNNTGKLMIKDWGKSNCSASLSEMLTEDDENRNKHFLLARYGEGENAELHYVPMGDALPTNFTAQTKTDEKSIIRKNNILTIKGWNPNTDAPEAVYGRSLGNILDGSEISSLHLLARTSSGETTYISPGKIKIPKADGTTIIDNDDTFSIPGFENAEGKVLARKDNVITWIEASGTPPDDITLLETKTESGEKKLGIKGFEAAAKNSIPWKNEEGEFVWGGASTVTNRILAGAGINITDNGGGAITISTQKLKEEAGISGEQVLSVITDMRYDAETHKFQCKRRQIRFNGTLLGEDPEWEDVFEATSHKEEHSTGN